MLDRNWTTILVGLIALGVMFALGCLFAIGLLFLIM